MKTVHIVCVECAPEAYAIRGAAEAFGAAVTVTWVGNSDQIVEYFASGPTHDLIVIAAHGDERGLLLPPLAEELRGKYRYFDHIAAADFASFARLRGNVVLNTSCCGGAPALANAFLAAGAGQYIGHPGYPDGNAALLYAIQFVYDALTPASDDDRAGFVIYSAVGEPKA